MIKFLESNNPNYLGRTIFNCKNSDITLAIAQNFSTRGEILTKSLSKNWIGFNLGGSLDRIRIETLSFKINGLVSGDFVLNIAGNGLYSIKGMTQGDCDFFL